MSSDCISLPWNFLFDTYKKANAEVNSLLGGIYVNQVRSLYCLKSAVAVSTSSCEFLWRPSPLPASDLPCMQQSLLYWRLVSMAASCSEEISIPGVRVGHGRHRCFCVSLGTEVSLGHQLGHPQCSSCILEMLSHGDEGLLSFPLGRQGDGGRAELSFPSGTEFYLCPQVMLFSWRLSLRPRKEEGSRCLLRWLLVIIPC